MDCYSCVYRSSLLGSAHSSCSALPSALGLKFLMHIYNFGNTEELKEHIDIETHGIKNGWANYPIDFDPIWIKHCKFYEKRENEEIPVS